MLQDGTKEQESSVQNKCDRVILRYEGENSALEVLYICPLTGLQLGVAFSYSLYIQMGMCLFDGSYNIISQFRHKFRRKHSGMSCFP